MDDYAQARRVIHAIQDNIRNDRVWLIHRWSGWKPNDKCLGGREAVYETLTNYRLMSYEEMLKAQREISRKYPGQLFEGHRIVRDNRE